MCSDSPLKVSRLASGRTLAGNTIINLVGQVLPLLFGVVAIPILIRELGADRFAVITIAWMVAGYFSLFDLGLGRALTQLIAERIGKENYTEVPGIFWTSIALMSVFAIVGVTVIAAIASPLVYNVFKVPEALQPETVSSFFILAASLPFVILTAAFVGTLTAYHRFGIINAIRVPMGIYSFTAPLLVLPFSRSTVPIVAALLVGKLVSCTIHLYYCLKIAPDLRAKISFQKAFVKPLFRFGGWMSISNLIGPLMVYFDRFFIASVVSMAAVTYYSIPYEFITKLWIIPGALMAVLFPTFAASYREKQAYTADLFNRAVTYQLLGIFPLVLAIVILAHDGLSFWIGTTFADNSYQVLQWLSIGVFINCLAQVPFTFLQGIGKPDVTSKLHLMEIVLYLPILWLLVKTFGIIGASIAWAARVVLDTTLLFYMSKRYFEPLSATAKPVGIYLITANVLLVGMIFVPRGLFGYATGVAVLFVSIIAGWKMLLTAEERSNLKSKIGLSWHEQSK